MPFTTLPRADGCSAPPTAPAPVWEGRCGPCTPVRPGNCKPPSWRTQTDTLPLRAVSGGRSGRPGIEGRRSAHTAAVRFHAYRRLCVHGAGGDFLEWIKGVREHPQPPGRRRGQAAQGQAHVSLVPAPPCRVPGWGHETEGEQSAGEEARERGRRAEPAASPRGRGNGGKQTVSQHQTRCTCKRVGPSQRQT